MPHDGGISFASAITEKGISVDYSNIDALTQ